MNEHKSNNNETENSSLNLNARLTKVNDCEKNIFYHRFNNKKQKISVSWIFSKLKSGIKTKDSVDLITFR